MMSMMYQAYQNHMDRQSHATAPSALKYLNSFRRAFLASRSGGSRSTRADLTNLADLHAPSLWHRQGAGEIRTGGDRGNVFATRSAQGSEGDSPAQPRMLLVALMSGHFATLLRATGNAAQDHDVYITDWHNPRDIPLDQGNSASTNTSST